MGRRVFEKDGRIVVEFESQNNEEVEDEVLEKSPGYGEKLSFASEMMSQEES